MREVGRGDLGATHRVEYACLLVAALGGKKGFAQDMRSVELAVREHVDTADGAPTDVGTGGEHLATGDLLGCPVGKKILGIVVPAWRYGGRGLGFGVGVGVGVGTCRGVDIKVHPGPGTRGGGMTIPGHVLDTDAVRRGKTYIGVGLRHAVVCGLGNDGIEFAGCRWRIVLL